MGKVSCTREAAETAAAISPGRKQSRGTGDTPFQVGTGNYDLFFSIRVCL